MNTYNDIDNDNIDSSKINKIIVNNLETRRMNFVINEETDKKNNNQDIYKTEITDNDKEQDSLEDPNDRTFTHYNIPTLKNLLENVEFDTDYNYYPNNDLDNIDNIDIDPDLVDKTRLSSKNDMMVDLIDNYNYYIHCKTCSLVIAGESIIVLNKVIKVV